MKKIEQNTLLISLSILVCISFFSFSIGQDSSNLQKLVDAHLGSYTKLVENELPEAFPLVLPDEIEIIGSVSEGFYEDEEYPTPPSYGNSEYYTIYLESLLDYSDLQEILDEAFVNNLGFSSYGQQTPVYEGSDLPWGFMEFKVRDDYDTQVEYEIYGLDTQYCNENYSVSMYAEEYYPEDENFDHSQPINKTIRISINSLPSLQACEEEIAYYTQINEDNSDYYEYGGWDPSHIPVLSLLPPKKTISLGYENIPYSPTPSSWYDGIAITEAWSSRTILATPIMGEELRSHYDTQLKEQGWRLVRRGFGGPIAWSEWRITSEDGTEWGGLLQILSDKNWQEGVAMPLFFLLEQP